MITLELGALDITVGVTWSSLSIAETADAPDELTATIVEMNETIRQAIGLANYASVIARRDGDIIFEGLLTSFTRTSRAVDLVEYNIRASGWDFLFPKCKVGVPDGNNWSIDDQTEYSADQLPEPYFVDPRARAQPTIAGVQSLMGNYWNAPLIDTETYVTDVYDGTAGEPDEVIWSGSDLAGALSELAQTGSATARWWLAPDSPEDMSVTAPHLALHFANLVAPELDEEDDLVAGLPTADWPNGVAPYEINLDDPDEVVSIRPMTFAVTADYGEKIGGVYVRGATGWVMDVEPAPEGSLLPYQLGQVHTGGTGWAAGTADGPWYAAYLDANVISESQRNIAAQAYYALHSGNDVSWDITVVGYHGWHKNQVVKLTSQDNFIVGYWAVINSVTTTAHDPFGEGTEYRLAVGALVDRSIGYALRDRRLKDDRKEIDPGQKFVVYHGDLLLDPADPDNSKSFIEGQFATANGTARYVEGVGATWYLWINGESVDLHDTELAYYLSDETTETDALGKVYATLHAGESATAADAADISIDVVLP